MYFLSIRKLAILDFVLLTLQLTILGVYIFAFYTPFCQLSTTFCDRNLSEFNIVSGMQSSGNFILIRSLNSSSVALDYLSVIFGSTLGYSLVATQFLMSILTLFVYEMGEEPHLINKSSKVTK
jgi:hypothetical protein